MDTNQATPAPAAPALGHYAIDPAASTVAFTTRHVFGLLPVRGTFALRSGSVDVAEPLGASRVRAEIDAASFTTGSRQRDRAVRSARFLDAGRHPLITFTADRVEATTVAGVLTVCGSARPVTLSIGESACGAGWFTARATVRVDRTAFGVTASRGMAGRHLDVTVGVRCVRA
ncbi:YceI family protein [Streptomyces sp. NBC_00083]|uniref:YceI family protein n=1 Tax=Streptomyces sp. NBC_00083 TaxID=2975647 RepID=UPI0022563347|nr:YceI family protein [Streptomyces sp. NBC_00083]MCX5384035.1 YceI family protein [Streptomyces sp. NBC_00083]